MKVTILGTGAYGLALSKVLNKNNNEIIMWTPFEEEKNELLYKNTSKKLDGFTLDSNIEITTNIKYALDKSKLIYIVLPTQFILSTCDDISKYIKSNQYICIASKGIDNSGLFLYQIVKHKLKTNNVGVISGPSFAHDIIYEIHSGVTLASKNKQTIKVIKEAMKTDYFNLEITNDIIGVSLCGAIKNVYAIASGILYGLGYPISTQSLYLTKAIQETKQMIYELGGNTDTVLTLSSIGDIFLTCTSFESRNYEFGTLIGKKVSKEKIEKYKKNNTIEGLYTLESAIILLKQNNIKSNMLNILYDIVFMDNDPSVLLEYLKI